MKNLKIFLTLLSFMFVSTIFAAPQSVTGKWKTIEDEKKKAKSIVEVYEQGGKVFGKIVELLTPGDKGKTCTACTGGDKNKPIEGLVIIKNLKPDGDEYAGGTIMDPKNGKVYKCKMKRNGNKLEVRGFIGFSLMGRTQVWQKAD